MTFDDLTFDLCYSHDVHSESSLCMSSEGYRAINTLYMNELIQMERADLEDFDDSGVGCVDSADVKVFAISFRQCVREPWLPDIL